MSAVVFSTARFNLICISNLCRSTQTLLFTAPYHHFLGSRLVLPCPIDVHLELKYFINYIFDGFLLGKPVLFWDVVNSSTYIQRTGHEWKLIGMFGPLGRRNERKLNKQKRSTKVEAVCFSLPCINHFWRSAPLIYSMTPLRSLYSTLQLCPKCID